MKSKFTYQLLEVISIEYDFDNPRIKLFLEIYKEKPTAEQIYNALNVTSADSGEGTSAPSFQSLEQSIKTQGHIIHPILVNKKPNGNLVVIEGNTRVAIYNKFMSKGISGEWGKIPAMVFDNLSPGEIEAIRLQSHLVGARQWDAYAKAKYLYLLRNEEHLTMAQIIDYCGGRQREVNIYIAAYEDMETYYRPNIDEDGFDHKCFSAFVELQKPEIKKAILKSKHNYNDFAKWVINNLIHPLNTVRDLPRILKNKNATDVFLREGAREAIKLIEVPTADGIPKDISLESLANEISKRIRAMDFNELRQLREDSGSSKVIAILRAKDEIDDLCKELSKSD